MKKILFVNACVRGESSRTLRLAKVFLNELADALPECEILEQDLTWMGLRSVDMQALVRKEALCDQHAWDDPLFAPTLQFQQADLVIIAAPYWDMSFPSILKVWVENMYVRNLTFKYFNDQSVGLCKGREAVYITTAGSPIGEYDWGTGYIRDVMKVLGIPGFTAIKAEALDLAGRDVNEIMAEAEKQARIQAKEVAQRLEQCSSATR
ncbi:MAG: NAD(P)H-dependent oxidoreductase [Clostridia bacterium]|nr:NAD(P)H-dependent oxidoreductase [Clostridia bacterium]